MTTYTWTVPGGFNFRSCPPAGCPYADTPHAHLQDQPTGWWCIVHPDGYLIDPHDPTTPDKTYFPVGQRPSCELRDMLWGRHRRPDPPAPPRACYEASWGWVHVRPGCRCPR